MRYTTSSKAMISFCFLMNYLWTLQIWFHSWCFVDFMPGTLLWGAIIHAGFLNRSRQCRGSMFQIEFLCLFIHIYIRQHCDYYVWGRPRQRYNSGLHKNVHQHKITYSRAPIPDIDLDNRNSRISTYQPSS